MRAEKIIKGATRKGLTTQTSCLTGAPGWGGSQLAGSWSFILEVSDPATDATSCVLRASMVDVGRPAYRVVSSVVRKKERGLVGEWTTQSRVYQSRPARQGIVSVGEMINVETPGLDLLLGCPWVWVRV